MLDAMLLIGGFIVLLGQAVHFYLTADAPAISGRTGRSVIPEADPAARRARTLENLWNV